LNYHWLKVSHALALGLQEGYFGVQALTFFSGWKVYMKPYLTSMDNLGQIVEECLGWFRGWFLRVGWVDCALSPKGQPIQAY